MKGRNLMHIESKGTMALLVCLLIALCAMQPVIAQNTAAEVNELKSQAYQLYEQEKFDQAAAAFQRYLSQKPTDARAAFDYASLLSQLNRHEEAARQFASIHEKNPQNESAYFKLGVEYVILKRDAEAEKVFAALEKSANRDMALAAAEARKRLKADVAREARFIAETRVFELANQFKNAEVVAAVGELEKKGPLSYPMEMQRLYSLQALGQFAPALERANRLAKDYPAATGLALVRADLLAQLGRRAEAEAIWRQIERDNAGTQAALEAGQRLRGGTAKPGEDRVFALARQQKHREVVDAVGELEKQGPLSFLMEMQRLYSLQALGQIKEALRRADKLAAAHPHATDLALLRSDLLIRAREWDEAAKILKQLKHEQSGKPIAREAENRLLAIPPLANLDKWFWGEAYLSGDYLGRFGTVIGSGFARHGYFIPNARWLQPYVEGRFTADTRSGVGVQRTIVTDNYVGFYGGVRAQPFATEYLYFYAQGGGNKDLLDRRHGGDFSADYQAGVYGFKSWGPGTVLHSTAPGAAEIPTTGNVPSSTVETKAGATEPTKKSDYYFWRGDWFGDAGADFSYYHRYSSWIGYGQAHEGFRLFQAGPHAGFDAYVVENLSWDVRGNYFDNLIEIGPGARWLWVPHRGWEVILRTEYLNGFYLGRDSLGTRGGAHGQYDDFRVSLSVGVRW